MSMVLAVAIAAAAQEAAATVIPLAIPPGTAVAIEHSDIRTLADGAAATFRQRAEISFAPVDGALIASYRMLDRRCDGPVPICAMFAQLGAGVDGRVFRFRIGLADNMVALLDATQVPLGQAEGESASMVASLVSQSEAAAPGAILAADLRHLIRFADNALPEPGSSSASSEGQLRLTEMTAGYAVIAIQWEPRVTQAVSLNGGGECRVSRTTGLVEHCRFVDWAGTDRTRPLRVREMRVTLLPVAAP